MKIDSSLMQLEDSLPDIEDTDSKDDPVFDCPEYANDIYQYLLEVWAIRYVRGPVSARPSWLSRINLSKRRYETKMRMY